MDTSNNEDKMNHAQLLDQHRLSPELTTSDISHSMDSLKLARAELEVKKCLGENCKETVLKSYSCARQKDILVQGRMYLTPNWLCFYSNILGWETKTAIKFTDVTSISKQRTALVFPNAILIEVGLKKYGFASLVHRDKVFHVLVTIWKNALSPSPLEESLLLVEISNWKQSSKELPSSVVSSSLTTDGSDTTVHDPPTPHNHHTLTLTTSTQEDSDSHSEILTDHVDGDCLIEKTVEYRDSTSSSGNSTTSLTSIVDSTRSEDSSTSVSIITTTTTSHQSKHQTHKQGIIPNTTSIKWLLHNLRTAGIHVTFGKMRYVNQCTTTVLINILLVIFIILLLVSTLLMFCRLSQMEPNLQPYLILQPWCRLCSSRTFEPMTSSPPMHHHQHL